MASLRKKYRPESIDNGDAPPVQTAPSVAVEPPPQAADAPTLPERLEEKDPVATAASSAIRDRLREMENAVRAGKTWHDSDFIDTVERYLGLKQETRSNGNGHLHDSSPMPAPTPPRNPPVRQQHGGSLVMSAPPTRDAPSFTTGRRQSDTTRLTADEADMARRLKISPEEYARQKEKMIRLKQAGMLQDG